MNALLTEAFEKYEERVAQIAKLQDELRRVEGDRDYWREQIVERAGGAKPAASRPSPAPKPTATPAPKPAPRAPAAPVAWTANMAKSLGDALNLYGSVVGQIIGAGGSVPVDRVPRADGEGVMSRISVSGTLATMRGKARARGLPDAFIRESAGRVVIDPGLVTAWRAWMEPHREERSLRSAINVEAGA
jgi:hypothetical protein